MKKVLFLIRDLGHGGAEKVLVNLVNNMDKTKFDITVMTLFDGGVNRQFLSPDVTYKTCFKKSIPGNSHIMKLWSPEQLHKHLIKESYDIEIAYLEGPSARVISGCPNPNTKLISWIHVEQHTKNILSQAFRTYQEAVTCYNTFHQIVCVSQSVQNDFCSLVPIQRPYTVLYNTVETTKILSLATEPIREINSNRAINLIAVGTLKPSKGYDRILNIIKKLVNENYKIHLFILGTGPMEKEILRIIQNNHLNEYVSLLGYQTNPYKYVAKADLFICASHAEGFSTAATEALIVGTPVCTVEVSGMKEMLGENSEYGIVTENSEDALYEGIKKLLDNPELLTHYKQKALERGKDFSTEKTVQAVEEILLNTI